MLPSHVITGYGINRAPVAQLVEHQAVTREVVSRTLVEKIRACSSRCRGLSSVVYHGWEGKYSERAVS